MVVVVMMIVTDGGGCDDDECDIQCNLSCLDIGLANVLAHKQVRFGVFLLPAHRGYTRTFRGVNYCCLWNIFDHILPGMSLAF